MRNTVQQVLVVEELELWVTPVFRKLEMMTKFAGRTFELAIIACFTSIHSMWAHGTWTLIIRKKLLKETRPGMSQSTANNVYSS